MQENTLSNDAIHARMLKLALEGKTFQELVKIFDRDEIPYSKVNYIYHHGVVKPQLPSIEYLVHHRKTATAIQIKQDQIDAMQSEMQLIEKERQLTLELAQQKAATQQTIDERRKADEISVIHTTLATSKNVALCSLNNARELFTFSDRIVPVLRAKVESWLQELENDKKVNYTMIKQGISLLRDITKMARESEAAAKLAAEVHILLREVLPESNHLSDIDMVCTTDSKLVAALFARHTQRIDRIRITAPQIIEAQPVEEEPS